MMNVEEALKALKIEPNPNAMHDFSYLMIFLVGFIIVSIFVKNFNKVRKFIIDKRLYNFIIEFKKINEEERKMLEKVFEKNKIQKKYEILILEGIYDKNIEREIVKIKMGFDLEEEKVKKIMKDNGFENIRNNDYFNKNLGIILEDLHDENVLTQNGVLFFIDTVFYIDESFLK